MSIEDKIRLQFARGDIDPELVGMPWRGFTVHGFIEMDCPLISHIDGNLYQGGCIDGTPLPTHFNYVVNLYVSEGYRLHQDATEVSHRFYDELGQDMSRVDDIAANVVRMAESGHVLIHCQAGLNRSGLVTARALMHQGKSASEAIDLVRSRSPHVLCNSDFEGFLRDNPVPAGTSQGPVPA